MWVGDFEVDRPKQSACTYTGSSACVRNLEQVIGIGTKCCEPFWLAENFDGLSLATSIQLAVACSELLISEPQQLLTVPVMIVVKCETCPSSPGQFCRGGDLYNQCCVETRDVTSKM